MATPQFLRDRKAYREGLFKLVYPFLEFGPDNELIFQSTDHEIIGLLYIVGADTGAALIGGKIHQLRDRLDSYERLHAYFFEIQIHLGNSRGYNHQVAAAHMFHGPDDLAQLVSADFGNDQIDKYNVRLIGGQQAQRAQSVFAGFDLVTIAFQQVGQEFEDHSVVIDHQYFLLHGVFILMGNALEATSIWKCGSRCHRLDVRRRANTCCGTFFLSGQPIMHGQPARVKQIVVMPTGRID